MGTIVNYGSNYLDTLNALKAALDSHGIFDAVTVDAAAVTLSAEINGVERVTITDSCKTITCYRADHTQIGNYVQLGNGNNIVTSAKNTVIFSHPSGSGHHAFVFAKSNGKLVVAVFYDGIYTMYEDGYSMLNLGKSDASCALPVIRTVPTMGLIGTNEVTVCPEIGEIVTHGLGTLTKTYIPYRAKLNGKWHILCDYLAVEDE